MVSKLLCELGIRTQSSNRGVTFASYVQNWCRGNSLACDLSAGHEWRQCGLRCVGLLSANSFVNRKFGSHGTGEEVRPFCAPLWVGALQCLAFNLYIWIILCLEESSMRMKKNLPFLLCSSFVPSFWMVNPSTWYTTFSNGGRIWNFCY